MSKKGEEVRQFILENTVDHPREVVALASKKFNLSRQAIYKHLRKLVNDGLLVSKGSTSNRQLLLQEIEWFRTYEINSALSESEVWRKDIKPQLGSLSNNVTDIWQYGFSEMINNAIDHS